jgi:hypothetical protein
MAKINAPIHCGTPSKAYAKTYGKKRIHSIESGFKCCVCGAIRLPDDKPFDTSDMKKMDSIREAGIAFDNSLN